MDGPISRRTVLEAAGVLGAGAVASLGNVLAIYSVDGVEVEMRRDGPGGEWTLAVTDRSRRASPGEEVARIDDLDPAVADLIREVATADRGRVDRDDVPDGVRDALARYDGVTGIESSDDVLEFGLFRNDPDAPSHLTVDAEVVDPLACAGNPAVVEFAVSNRDDVERTIGTGIHPPFSVLHAERADGSGRFRLWRREAPPLHLVPLPTGIPAVAVRHPIAPGETQRRRYQVRVGSLVVPGGYVVRESVNSRPTGSDGEPRPPSEVVEWTARFRVRAGP